MTIPRETPDWQGIQQTQVAIAFANEPEKPSAIFVSTAEGLRFVPALVTGQLAVNAFVATDDHKDDEVWWSITHCNTGYKITDFCTEEAAIECARELEQLDWSGIQLVNGKPVIKGAKAWKTQVLEILKRNKDKHSSPWKLPLIGGES